MQFEYNIEPNLGNEHQVGLRLNCVSKLQAEKIYRALRQQSYPLSQLLNSTHSAYTHCIFVTTSVTELEAIMPQIQESCGTGDPSIARDHAQRVEKATKDFKTWQKQFLTAIKQLNSCVPQTASLVQEIDRQRLTQQIAAGRVTEVEELLLKQFFQPENITLRSLIALYAQTEQFDKVVELCKAYRSQVLALPVSGRLVEQIVSAHLRHYQQNGILESLHTGQHYAQEFLPELERLHQANGVRRLLHQSIAPQEPLPTGTLATLGERLGQLLEIEPAERIPQLEKLNQENPKATNVILALAASYAATKQYHHALELYETIPEQTEKIYQRRAQLLLAESRFEEVITLLLDTNELSPSLAGLRGAAFYHLGEKAKALPWLEKAWTGNVQELEILLPLARLWATAGNLEHAAQAYEVLLDTAEQSLTLEDYVHIAAIAYGGGFGDISDEQVVGYYEECLKFQGNEIQNLNDSTLRELLRIRLQLRAQLPDIEAFLNAFSDWLEYLANRELLELLEAALADVRTQSLCKISLQHQFELLEVIEPYMSILPKLRQSLVNDYQNLALTEIDEALRHNRTESVFFPDLLRALQFLNSETAHEVYEYRQQRQTEAASFGLQTPAEIEAAVTTPNLSSLRLAIVGGHEATRRAVIHELQDRYGVGNIIEIPPSDEAYVDRDNVKSRVSNCNLIALITGYMGHDLSNIVSQLKKSRTLQGEVMPLSCRGKTGIIRAILSWWSEQK